MVKIKKMTGKIDRKYVNILGTKIDSTTMQEVLGTIGYFLQSQHKFSLFTANPELMVMADNDINLKNIINNADLVIPDGVGLKIASLDLNITKGRCLFLDLIDFAKLNKKKTFFLGASGIKGVIPGPKLNLRGEPVDLVEKRKEEEIVKKINQVKPDFLFVGFGMPKQEKWIARNLGRLDIGGAVAVGGTFDYVFGKAKLPPRLFEEMGLEWFWRLIREPRRIGRIFNAVVVFPLKIIFWNLNS